MSDSPDLTPEAIAKAVAGLNATYWDRPFNEHPIAAMLKALLARVEAAEAELAAVRAELNPPPEWPLHLAARAAKDALARREAVIAGLVEAASRYAHRYCKDEADDPDLCVTPEQHEDAKALFAALAAHQGETQE